MTNANQNTNPIQGAIEKAKKNGNLQGQTRDGLQGIIQRYEGHIKQTLPAVSDLSSERFISLAVNVISQTPGLQKCRPETVIGCLFKGAALGLNPEPQLGEIYFVPYKDVCTIQIGYQGYITMAYRNKSLKSITAHVVRESDDFNYELGLQPTLRHKPDLNSPAHDDGRNVVAAYAIAELNTGGQIFTVLSRNEIERLRMLNPSEARGGKSAWTTHYASMAKAKAIKSIHTLLPGAIDGVDADGATYDVKSFAGGNKKGAAEYPEDITVEVVEEPKTAPKQQSPTEMTPEEMSMYVDQDTGELVKGDN